MYPEEYTLLIFWEWKSRDVEESPKEAVFIKKWKAQAMLKMDH